MGKSLNELVSDLGEDEFDNSHAPLSKLVRCPNCGRRLPVPGTHVDVLCWNCKKMKDHNNQIITSDWYNFARDKLTIKKKRDSIIPAIHNADHFNKTIDDRT